MTPCIIAPPPPSAVPLLPLPPGIEFERGKGKLIVDVSDVRNACTFHANRSLLYVEAEATQFVTVFFW